MLITPYFRGLKPRPAGTTVKPYSKLRSTFAILPARPAVVTWSSNIPNISQTFGNTEVGDCTIAGMFNQFKTWLGNNSQPCSFTDQQALDTYSAITGYNPADPSTDCGAALTQVLAYAKATGVCGIKIDDYFDIDPTNLDEFKEVIWLYGGAYAGLRVCDYDEQATRSGCAWDNPNPPSAWAGGMGGHCVEFVDADEGGAYGISWGIRQYATNDWLAGRLDEACGMTSTRWVGPTGRAPSGFTEAQLMADESLLRPGPVL